MHISINTYFLVDQLREAQLETVRGLGKQKTLNPRSIPCDTAFYSDINLTS